MSARELRVVASDRLDRALSAADPELSRRRARVLIQEGLVFIDGRRCKVASRNVHKGARLVVHDDKHEVDHPFAILHEDDQVWVINKHPGLASNTSETSARRSVAEYLGDRARIVHRLDRDTSGVMVVAKTQSVVRTLSDAFAKREVKKEYVAVVEGCPADQDVDLPIGTKPKRPQLYAVVEGGKPSFTTVRQAYCAGDYGGVRLEPKTGRTHQLRVHLAHIGHPILGDIVYGGPAAARVNGDIVKDESSRLCS